MLQLKKLDRTQILKNKNFLILLMTINKSKFLDEDINTFVELVLFLTKYSFISNIELSTKEFSKRDFSHLGEIFSQNSRVQKTPQLNAPQGNIYMGARYLDPKYSRWISVDPALGEYIPQAPVSDEARKHNQNLPGMGGIYNHINGDLYHYAGNNPVRYVDPDGKTEVYFIFALDTNNVLTPERRAKNIEINNYIQNSMDNAFKELFIHDISYDIIENADSSSISAAFSDKEAIMIILVGHGNDSPGFTTSTTGQSYTPDDIPENISSSLGIVIFESCSQGAYMSDWQEKLGSDVKIFGWQEPIQVREIGMFNRGEGKYKNTKNLNSYIQEAIIRKWSNIPIDYL